MKMFLIFLVVAFARSEKLDLTYLPPPGSQYAGGRPEDIQVPLEFPRETYTTTLQPQGFDDGITNPEDYQATIGINRGLPTDSVDVSDMTSGSKAPFSYFQNTYKVPTTTVSYAFTQTTTHPPTEGFETTIGPQFGFPSQENFNNFQSQEPSLTYQGNLGQPGFEQTQFGGQTPTTGTVAQYPGYPIQPQAIAGENQQALNRPGFQQNVDQFVRQRPTAPTYSPVSQFTGSKPRPQDSGSFYQEDLQSQNRPEYKPAQYQFGEQNPTFAPISGPINKFPAIPQQNLGVVGQNVRDQQLNSLNQPQPGYQQTVSGVRPGVPFSQTQYQNKTLSEDGLVNQPGLVPSTVLPKEYFSTSRPVTTYGNRVNNIQGSSTLRPYAPQNSLPNQIGNGQILNDENVYQQQPGLQVIGKPTFDGNNQSIFRPSSTVAPTAFTPGIQNGQFPTASSAVSGSYSTPAYPEGQYNNQVGGDASVYRQERPQADNDRNAVILNYENVITPEGFAYSFDTSNGIHADESGTATDGVKAKGSYSYIGDDGKLYSVVYTADENGYQPHGDHLPTPPPIPDAIQDIIEKVKKEKEAGIYHDGSYDDDKYGHKNYQGAMRQRPQNFNKVFANGADVPEEYVTALPNMKPRRPLTEIRKPIVSSGDLSDFDVANQEQSKYGDNEEDNNDDKMSEQILTQRPINRVTTTNVDEGNSDFQDGSDEIQFIETSSKRPSEQPIRKNINTTKGSSKDDDSYRRRPVNKISSQQIEDLEYGSEKPYYENDDSITRLSNKGLPKRPTSQKKPQYYDEDDTISSNTFENDTSYKRPIKPGSPKRPVSAPGHTVIEYKTTRPASKFTGRRPTYRPILENVQDQSRPDDKYNIQKGSSRPSYKPFEYHDEDNLHTVTDDYVTEEYVTKLPSTIQPSYRPETSDTQINGDEYQPNDEEKYIDSSNFENIPSQKYGDRRPVSVKPTKTFGGKYTVFDENVPKENYYNRSQPTYSTKYGGTGGIPQTTRPISPPEAPIQNNRGPVIIGDKTKGPGTYFGQKLTKPNVYQQTGQIKSVDFNQQPLNETGYQYFSPQKKFEQDEVKGFPGKFTGTTKIPSNMGLPQQNGFYEKEGAKSKPFMTPNVSHDDMGYTVDDYDQEETTQEIAPGKNQKQQNDSDTEKAKYSDSGTTLDQIFGDEISSSTQLPGKYPSSTYGPSSTTRRPLRPQNKQYTQNVPGVQGNRRPLQGIDRYNGYKTTKVPYGGVSSTTPMPSNGNYYGSTSRPTTPEEQNNYVTGNTYQTPSQGFISSTTPLPSQKPNYQGSYQKNSNKPQYQSTIRPTGTLRPTTEYIEGTTAQKLPTVSSTYSTSNVGPYKNVQYGPDLPSTTYRPNYPIAGANEPSSTAVPGVAVDGFGRPIRPEYSTTVQEYSPGSTSFGKPSSDQRTKGFQPGETLDEQFRGQQRFRPSTKTGQKEVPSTFLTTTPKIIGEDFSGPKQQQKFDPKTGYYYK